MTCFIGISGPKGIGKSYLAREIATFIRDCDMFVSTFSFATPIKMLATYPLRYSKYTLPFHVYAFWNNYGAGNKASKATKLTLQAYKTFPPDPDVKNRKLLQTIGHEIGRVAVHPDFWLNIAKYETHGVDVAVFDDVRYDNEALFMNLHVAIQGEYEKEHPSEYGLSVTPTVIIPPRCNDLSPILKYIYLL